MASNTRQTIKVPSIEKDVYLDVWFYQPSTAPPYPVVVAGHGMTVIKDAGLAPFGERWAQDAGYASLILDYRGFGASGGEPRNLVSVEKQLQDYRSVIEWARGRPETFRSDKIVVMGSAFSGLYVADLVVHDPGIAGGMAQCPLLDGYATMQSVPLNLRFIFWACVDVIKGKLGLAPTFVKAVGKPGDFAFLAAPASLPGYTALFAQGSTPFSQAPNLIAPRVGFDIMAARPGLELKHAKCPVLIVLAEKEEMLPSGLTEKLVEDAQGKVKLVVTPGGHFDIIRGGKGHETNINAQLEFLRGLL